MKGYLLYFTRFVLLIMERTAFSSLHFSVFISHYAYVSSDVIYVPSAVTMMESIVLITHKCLCVKNRYTLALL